MLIAVVIGGFAIGCDRDKTPTELDPDASDTSAKSAPELPAPHPPPEPKPAKHTVKFAAKEAVVCKKPEEALAGECSGSYARYGVKLGVGQHAWIGTPGEEVPAGAVPYFRGPDQDHPSGFVDTSLLVDKPDLGALADTTEAWSKVPLADRKNLVDPAPDALFRIPVAANLATPRSESVEGVPHPVFPLKLDYIGAPTPMEFSFAECLLSGGDSSWVANHSCLLDATCAELKYVCTPDYCDAPVFIARRIGGDDVPAMKVVAIADRHGAFVCPEFELADE